ASLSSLAVTESLSRGTTATCENSAPAGFQHFVQPHTWLCALWLFTDTATFLSEHFQFSVPPLKLAAAPLMPLSTAGWMEGVAMIGFLLDEDRSPEGRRARRRRGGSGIEYKRQPRAMVTVTWCTPATTPSLLLQHRHVRVESPVRGFSNSQRCGSTCPRASGRSL